MYIAVIGLRCLNPAAKSCWRKQSIRKAKEGRKKRRCIMCEDMHACMHVQYKEII